MTAVVWVGLRQNNERLVFHRLEDCHRGAPRKSPRIPTVEDAALAAGLVPCASCGAIQEAA